MYLSLENRAQSYCLEVRILSPGCVRHEIGPIRKVIFQ